MRTPKAHQAAHGENGAVAEQLDERTGWSRTATTTPAHASLGEDACRSAPARARNNTVMNNIALAVVRHRGFRFVPEAVAHFSMRREDAFDAVLTPG